MPALNTPAGGAVQLQLSSGAAPADEHGGQPSLAGLPGTAGLAHLQDGFCSPGNALAWSKCQVDIGCDAMRGRTLMNVLRVAAILCEGTRAAAFALMTSQRDSTSPHKQRPSHHTALHATNNGSGSRTGVSPASGSTPSDRNAQSPAEGATKGGEQPVHLAHGTAASAAQASARGIITQMACVAEVEVCPAHSQQVSEPHKSGSDHDLPPTQEGSADAEPAQRLGELPPCSQGAGLNLNLSPEEAMLTGATPPHPAAQYASHRGPHSAVDSQPVQVLTKTPAGRFRLDAGVRAGAAAAVGHAQQELVGPVGPRDGTGRGQPGGGGVRRHVGANAAPAVRRAGTRVRGRRQGSHAARAGGQHAVHCDHPRRVPVQLLPAPILCCVRMLLARELMLQEAITYEYT